MRVVFDAYWWVEGPTSLRHVLREIVLKWHERFPDDSIALVVRAEHLERARSDVPAGTVLASSRFRPQALLASIAVERVRRRLGYDVALVQNFATRSRGVSAVYLHDVLFLSNPEWFTRTERAYFRWMARWAPRADVVFSSSATEGDRIRSLTRAVRVLPVGLGLSEELVDSLESQPVEGLEAGSFLLTVGRLNVRKNLERTVLGALESGQVSAERPLVVAGGASGLGQEHDERIRRAVEEGVVRFTGHVSDAELRWLYASTSLFVFLSLGEGFGMPPIEARAFGAPVLAGDLAVMRENLGDEGAYVDPSDVPAIARAIAEALAAPRSRASALPSKHDWGRTVESMRSALSDRIADRTAGQRDFGRRYST